MAMRRARMTVVAVVLMTGVAWTAFCGEADDRRRAAERLLGLFNMGETYQDTMQQWIEMSMNVIDTQDLSAVEKREARKAMKTSMNLTIEAFSWDRIKGTFVDIYVEVLTLEELNGLIQFYESPIGRRFIRKQPQLTAVTLRKMQSLMQDVVPRIQKDVQRALAEWEADIPGDAGQPTWKTESGMEPADGIEPTTW